MRGVVGLCAVVLLSCGASQGLWTEGEDGLDVAEAPLLGASGQDEADRGCQVVLRTLERAANTCTAGLCWWTWKGTLDVSAQAVAEGGRPGVLFKNVYDATTWTNATAAKVSGAPVGFQRYRFTLKKNTLRDGMSATAYARAAVEVAPYVRMPTGARLFDHNRNPGEFDNYRLSQAGGWAVADDAAACAPPPAVKPSLLFDGAFQTQRTGALVAGQPAVLAYALDRLPTCRGTHNGFPAWDLRAFVRFSPSGQVVDGTVRGFLAPNGVPQSAGAFGVPFEVAIPSGTTGVEVWFKNFTGAGSTCEAWDSNFGANYRFDVEPRALPAVQWVGNGGSSFTRACSRQDGVPASVTMDSYLQTRACAFVTVDVYAPGVTDAALQKPWAVYAVAELSLDGQPLAPKPLSFVGRVGNDLRFQFEVPKSDLYYGPKWATLRYTLKASTDGATWKVEPTRAVERDASFCNPAWGDCAR